MQKYIAILSFLILLASCAHPKIIEGITTPNKSEAAVILGEGGGAGEFFAFLTTPITGSKFETLINKIDGKWVGGTASDREWWLVPGEHTLRVVCSHLYASMDYTQISELVVTVEKGHTYQLTARPSKNGCLTKFIDITDQT